MERRSGLTVVNVITKPVAKKAKKTTAATAVVVPRTASGQYKLTEPGKDFRLIKGGWPSAKKNG
jgi:hypothetical protein